MVDEAHELRKPGLLIMAILRNYVRNSKGKKKLIVTSATLDTSLFKTYFQDLKYKVIETVTPTYDVEVHYTYFPDLESNLINNTTCHLKIIFDVNFNNLAHQEKLQGIFYIHAKHPHFLAFSAPNQRNHRSHRKRLSRTF